MAPCFPLVSAHVLAVFARCAAFSQSVKGRANAGRNTNELLLRIHKTLSDTGDGAPNR
jgi:hypothetical protein